jgi:hypothetical protein
LLRSNNHNSRNYESSYRAILELLRDLFPEPSPRRERPLVTRGLLVVVSLAALGLGAVLLLGRIPGTPAWDGIYAEDLGIFLTRALQHPWHLLSPYAGYLQLFPQLLGQFAALLPLPDAAAFLAISGALVTSGCGLFVFHVSAGHIRSPLLRGAAGLAVVLLPVAPLEIADCGVNTPWYLMYSLFWAALWRPRTRTGTVGAALLGFAAVTSNILAVVFAPLLLLRIAVLPRLRDHAVTAGWAVGCLLQSPFVLSGLAGAHSRSARSATPGQAASFYGHDVLLPSLGWHLSWHLRDSLGRNDATLLVAGLLAAVFASALITRPRPTRVFVVTALAIGFAFTMIAATETWWVTILPVTPMAEPGSRYTAIPILLLEAAVIAAADSWLRRSPASPSAIAAAVALVAVLTTGWIADYRYHGNRANVIVWAPTAARWLHACQSGPVGPGDTITERIAPGSGQFATIPCAHLNR